MLKELSARQFLLDVVLIFLLYQESFFHECLVLSQISVVQHQWFYQGKHQLFLCSDRLQTITPLFEAELCSLCALKEDKSGYSAH